VGSTGSCRWRRCVRRERREGGEYQDGHVYGRGWWGFFPPAPSSCSFLHWEILRCVCLRVQLAERLSPRIDLPTDESIAGGRGHRLANVKGFDEE
jgi:hypothetical protein